MMQKGQTAFVRGESDKKNVRFAFGAQFVGVRVHRLTRETRAPSAPSPQAVLSIRPPLEAS
jgi:hypothetical protein